MGKNEETKRGKDVNRKLGHLERSIKNKKMASIRKDEYEKKQEGKRRFVSIGSGGLCLKEVEAKGEIVIDNNKKGKL